MKVAFRHMNELMRKVIHDIFKTDACEHSSLFLEEEMDLASFGFWSGRPKRQNYRRCGMEKIEEISRKRKAAHKKLLDLKSKTYKAFLAMEEAAYADGMLPKKTKEMIAVGISLVINCESCMEWHIKEAARCGAAFEEVFEALEVGMEMGGGPATAYVRFALDVMEAAFDN